MSGKTSGKTKKGTTDGAETAEALDEYCKKLLSFFDMLRTKYPEKTFGFNEILRKLTYEQKQNFSKQTLAFHLKHLLDQGIIEFKEETSSPLRIKPRKYKLTSLWDDLLQFVRPHYFPDYEKMVTYLEQFEIEDMTILLLEMSVDVCVSMFEQQTATPEPIAAYCREYTYDYIENLAKAYRKVLSKKKDPEEALKAIGKFNENRKQEMMKEYHHLIEKLQEMKDS